MNQSLFSKSLTSTTISNGISIIIPFRQRPEEDSTAALKRCITLNREIQNTHPIEFVIVEENNRPHPIEGDGIKYVFLPSRNSTYFNKCRSVNCGVAKATYPLQIMNDVDIIMQTGYVKSVHDILQQYDMGSILKEVYYLKRAPNPDIDFDYDWKYSDRIKTQCVGGNVFWRKSAFIRVGGMNERFVGHGVEDAEFYWRAVKSIKFYDDRTADTLHIPHPASPGRVNANLSLWHNLERQPLQSRIISLRKELSRQWNL